MPTQEGDGLIIFLACPEFSYSQGNFEAEFLPAEQAELLRTHRQDGSDRNGLDKNLFHALNGGCDCCCANFCLFLGKGSLLSKRRPACWLQNCY